MNVQTRQRLWGVGVAGALALLLGNEFRLAQGAPAADAAYWLLRVQVCVAALGTLAVYSFLMRDNPFYQAFEHALLGCATGMGCAIGIQDVLVSKWWLPMCAGLRAWFGGGPSAGAPMDALLLLPGIIGLLWYFQFSRRLTWLSRIPLCVGLGAGAGMAFKGIFNSLMPQITGTFKPLWPGPHILRDASVIERAAAGFENLVFVLGTVSVLSYFFFAFGRSRLSVRAPAQLGRWYLMLSLGAFFGNTFMSRLSALIERFHFLFAEWLRITPV
jgi:hypothetical protein